MSSTTYDVIIIGAGSIGTPTAMALAKNGLKTLVVDKLSSAGQGANKAAIGGVRATHSDPAKISLALRSLEIFSNWKEQHGDEIEWYSGGYTFLAYSEREENILKALLKTQQSFGLNIDWYDTEEILEIIPAVNPKSLRGATFSPDDGFCSNLRAMHAFYKNAQSHGAAFKFREKVIAIQTRHTRITGIVTDKGNYQAPVVINAAGPWAAGVGEMISLKHPVQPDSHEAGITEPVQIILEPMVVDIRLGPCSANVYFYQQRTGQFNFCLTPDPQLWGYDCQETSDFLPLVSRRIIDIIPSLANIRVRRTWRGLYPMTPDGFPIIGWANEIEGYLMAIGMCGQGFMLGPGTGELIARILLYSETSPADKEILERLSPYRDFSGKEKLK